MEKKMKTYWFTTVAGFILFAFTIKASAEGVQAPLIFDYGAFKGPSIMESETIKTSGTVKAISCYWDFVGKVSMEVSANAGRAYVKIGNGTVLKEGFIPGNELRFRATLGGKSILKKVVLGYVDSSGAKRLPQNPQLAAYKNHKPIYVTGGSEELFDYPLEIIIDKNDLSGAQEDYRDIRFIAADGATELEYYHDEEKGTFWVKIPQIPKNAGLTLYLYYGNPLAVNKSNAETVFVFYDDFNGAKLNEERWQKALGLKGDCSVKDGYLQLRDASVLSADFAMKEGILEFKARAEKNAAIQAIFQQAQDEKATDAKSDSHFFPFKEIFYSSGYPGAEHTIAINDVAKLNIGKPIQPLEDYIYKAVITPAAAIFERYSGAGAKEVEVQFMDAGAPGDGYIGLKADGKVYYDWVRVRPYAAVEPQATLLMGG